MVVGTTILHNPSGILVEAAGVLIQETNKFKASIHLKVRDTDINAKSLLSILGGGVRDGDELEIICQGEDETVALKRVQEIISQGLLEVS